MNTLVFGIANILDFLHRRAAKHKNNGKRKYRPRKNGPVLFRMQTVWELLDRDVKLWTA
jgi:hypothetical protein